jgi:predicted 3-demethylubiquinone-9 3-methyltransferase (glyoxalase superfamily)
MEDLTREYLSMLHESNGCLTMYTSHILDLESKIKDLRAELKEKESKLMHYMTKDSFSISRHDFRSFFVTVKNRRETDQEWEAFQTKFHFKLQLEIYKWIDSLQ